MNQASNDSLHAHSQAHTHSCNGQCTHQRALLISSSWCIDNCAILTRPTQTLRHYFNIITSTLRYSFCLVAFTLYALFLHYMAIMNDFLLEFRNKIIIISQFLSHGETQLMLKERQIKHCMTQNVFGCKVILLPTVHAVVIIITKLPGRMKMFFPSIAAAQWA